jgi:hypothetical protein
MADNLSTSISLRDPRSLEEAQPLVGGVLSETPADVPAVPAEDVQPTPATLDVQGMADNVRTLDKVQKGEEQPQEQPVDVGAQIQADEMARARAEQDQAVADKATTQNVAMSIRAGASTSKVPTLEDITNTTKAYQRIDPNLPDDVIYQKGFSYGNSEDYAQKSIVAGARGYLTPHPIDPATGMRDTKKYLPNVVDESGNFNVNYFDVEVFKTEDRRFAELVQNGGLAVVTKVPQGTEGSVDLGNGRAGVFTFLKPFNDYAKMSGMKFDSQSGSFVGPEPKGWIAELRNRIFSTDETDSVARLKDTMIKAGITNSYDQLMIMRLHDNEMREAIGTFESTVDLGLFYSNLAVELAVAPLQETPTSGGKLGISGSQLTASVRARREGRIDPLQDVTYASLTEEEREQAILQDSNAKLLASIGAEEVLKAEAETDPNIHYRITLDGDRQITVGTDGMDFKYYAEVVADRMGISVEAAEDVLAFRQDMFETVARLIPETVAFGGPAFALRVGSSARLFQSYEKWMINKYGTETLEAASKKASKNGDSIALLQEEFARTQLKGFGSKRVFERSRTESVVNKINEGFYRTPAGRAVETAEQAQEISRTQQRVLRNVEIMNNPNATAIQKAQAAKNFVINKTKLETARHVTSKFSRAATTAFREEAWVAVGMGVAGETAASIFGDGARFPAEFIGALTGEKLIGGGISAAVGISVGVATLPFNLVASADSIKSLLVNTKNTGSIRSALKLLPSNQRKILTQIIDAGGPELEQEMFNRIQMFEELNAKSLEIRDINGNAIFEKDDMPTLLTNIIGLSMVTQMVEALDTSVMGMDIINAGTAMSQRIEYNKLQQQYLNQLTEAIERMAPNVDEIAKQNPELARIVESASEYVDAQKLGIENSYNDAMKQVEQLETDQRALFEVGITSNGVPSVSANDIFSTNARKILEANVDDTGTIVNYEKYLNDLQNEVKRLQSNYIEVAKLNTGTAALNGNSNIGMQLGSTSASNRKMDRTLRNTHYDAVTNPYKDLPRSQTPRADVTDFVLELRESGGLSYLNDADYTAALRSDLDDATLNGIDLSAGRGTPEDRVALRYFNVAAVDNLRYSPLGNLIGISEDVALGDASVLLGEYTSKLKEALSNVENPSPQVRALAARNIKDSPIDSWLYINDVLKTGDPAVLSAISRDLTPDNAAKIADNMRLAITVDEYKGIRSALSVSDRQATTPSGVSAIRMRQDLKNIVLSPESGFSVGFYEGTKESVVDQIGESLDRADNFNYTFNKRWNNPQSKAFGIVRKDDASHANTMDKLVNNALSKADKTESITDTIDQELGSELARLLGGHYDEATDRFYLIEGSEAAEQAKIYLKQYTNNRWWLSESGSYIRETAARGELPINSEIDVRKAKELNNFYARDNLKVGTTPDAKFLTTIQRIDEMVVYKLDADGNLVMRADGSNRPERARMFEDTELYDFTDLDQTGIPPSQQIPAIRKEIETATNGVNTSLKDIKNSVEKNKEANLQAIQAVSVLTTKLKGDTLKSTTVILDTIGRGNIQDITSVRSAYISRAISGDSGLTEEAAKEIFDQRMRHILSFEVLSKVRGPDGAPDPVKLNNLLQDPYIVAALDEFAPGARQNYQTIADLYGAFSGVDPKNKVNISGIPKPILLESEFSKFNAIGMGKLGVRQYAFQTLLRQARQNKVVVFRTMMQDPKLGRMFVEALTTGEPLSSSDLKMFELRLTTAIARDLYLSQSSTENGVVVPLLNSAGRVVQGVTAVGSSLLSIGGEGDRPQIRARGGSMEEQLRRIEQDQQNLNRSMQP